MDQFPDWFRSQWQILNRAMSDITKIFSNGIVLSENMSFVPRTTAVTTEQDTVVLHSLARNPIILLISGRVLGFRVKVRTSNSATIWCKLPSTRIVSGRGKRDTFDVEEGGWFFPGDTVKCGDVVTSVVSIAGGTMLTRDAVVITSDMTVSLYQESVDLLLF
jgi:hypothetical protein